MKYVDRIMLGGYNIILHSDTENCFDVFLQKEYCISETEPMKSINIYSVIKKDVVKNVIYESKKIRCENYNIYISKRESGPKGLIIEKINRGTICGYMIISEDVNSQLTLIRSVLIKLFFYSYTQIGAYPIHCASMCYKGNSYLFIADSNGGKSTVYFSFASYSNSTNYLLMGDDTILCRVKGESIVGSVMPLKPSLRKGTMDHVPPTNCFRTQFEHGFNMDDQIYVDIKKLKNSNIVLESKIKAAFFLNFSDAFGIVEVNDLQMLKKKLAIIISGYKATPVNEQFLDFLNKIVTNIRFYDIYIPPNMKNFYDEFDTWLDTNGGSK